MTCGASAGAQPATDLRRIFWHHLKVFGSSFGSRDELRQVLNFLESSGTKPVIDKVFPAGTSGHGPAAIWRQADISARSSWTLMVKAERTL